MANYFLLGSSLDWQIPSELARQNANRLVKEILGDPDDLWRTITSVSESEWNSKRNDYHLHRYRAGHNRLWSIGKRICNQYDGDAREAYLPDVAITLNNQAFLYRATQRMKMLRLYWKKRSGIHRRGTYGRLSGYCYNDRAHGLS
jgi:hypothetical protein